MKDGKRIDGSLPRVAWLLLGWLSGVLCCVVVTLVLPSGGGGGDEPAVRVDTIRDTVVHREPVAVRDTLIRWVAVARHDTVPYIVHDSLYIPITQKEYTDDTTYRAWVSGYEARLDSIETYGRTVIVTRQSGGSAVGLGLGVGYGLATGRPDLWAGVTVDLGRLFGKGRKRKKRP